jgi:hypothetical protein
MDTGCAMSRVRLSVVATIGAALLAAGVTGCDPFALGDPPAGGWYAPAADVTGTSVDDRWDASDARLDGLYSVEYGGHGLVFGGCHHGEPCLWINAATYRIENADGRWSGTLTEMSAQEPDFIDATAVLTGEGAYEGLTAYLSIEGTQNGTPRFRGFIFPGPMPAIAVPSAG